jgi:hypothetical protein
LKSGVLSSVVAVLSGSVLKGASESRDKYKYNKYPKMIRSKTRNSIYRV